VAVIYAAEHYRLMATEPIAAGATVCPIRGERTKAPTRWTVQVGARAHIEADPATTLDDCIERFPWRYLNHSCEPNTRIAGLHVIAIRPIRAGEELTFNYNSTEFDMTSPFACHCGSPVCHGMIRGFTHLTADERERLRPLLSPHLRRLLKRSAGST
jgi:non-ribosomal peptide synthetase component F